SSLFPAARALRSRTLAGALRTRRAFWPHGTRRLARAPRPHASSVRRHGRGRRNGRRPGGAAEPADAWGAGLRSAKIANSPSRASTALASAGVARILYFASTNLALS